MSKKSERKKWSEIELEDSVRVYLEMRDLQARGKKFSKKHYYEMLRKQYKRTPKAYEYRMQNISFVFLLLGRKWISGLKPAKNVGARNVEIIIRSIHKHEKSEPPIAKFERKVNKVRKSKNIPLPSGSKTPRKSVNISTNYSRDPYVAAWILKQSGGYCECCDKQAPFKKADGDFYLEVHHLKRLADDGSDTVSNALAVCPNCHRKLHYGEEKGKLLNYLYEKKGRLVRE